MFNPATPPAGLVELETLFLNPILKLADRATVDPDPDPKTLSGSSHAPCSSLADEEKGLESTLDPEPNLFVLPSFSFSSCPTPCPWSDLDPAPVTDPEPGPKPANHPALLFSPFAFPLSEYPLGFGLALGEGGGMSAEFEFEFEGTRERER